MNRSAEILKSSRRDARFVAGMWATCCLYTVGYCGLFAYQPGSAPDLLFGIPSWVVWGILAPWMFATAVTCWYALGAMKDEDLGEDHAAPDEGADG